MSDTIERRSFVIDEELETGTPSLFIETRAVDPESADGTESRDASQQDWIVGYAAKFGVNSLDLGDFVERIDPGAFGIVRERRGRKRALETRALFNHDANFPLARYPGTLKLSVDDVGLRYEFPVPDTTYGRDLAANIKAGIVRGSSFSFTVGKDGESWSIENGRSVRTVTKVDDLYDVGPVTYPAYPDSDASVARRSFDAFRAEAAKAEQAEESRKASLEEASQRFKEFLKTHGREIG